MVNRSDWLEVRLRKNGSALLFVTTVLWYQKDKAVLFWGLFLRFCID